MVVVAVVVVELNGVVVVVEVAAVVVVVVADVVEVVVVEGGDGEGTSVTAGGFGVVMNGRRVDLGVSTGIRPSVVILVKVDGVVCVRFLVVSGAGVDLGVPTGGLVTDHGLVVRVLMVVVEVVGTVEGVSGILMVGGVTGMGIVGGVVGNGTVILSLVVGRCDGVVFSVT